MFWLVEGDNVFAVGTSEGFGRVRGSVNGGDTQGPYAFGVKSRAFGMNLKYKPVWQKNRGRHKEELIPTLS